MHTNRHHMTKRMQGTMHHSSKRHVGKMEHVKGVEVTCKARMRWKNGISYGIGRHIRHGKSRGGPAGIDFCVGLVESVRSYGTAPSGMLHHPCTPCMVCVHHDPMECTRAQAYISISSQVGGGSRTHQNSRFIIT